MMSASQYGTIADRPRTSTAAGAGGLAISLAPYVMLALALIGMADAFYVARASYLGQPLREIIIEGANTVLNSPYARIFGVPLSYLGLVYYSFMFGLAALLAFDPRSRGLRAGALIYTAMGVCSSIYFMYLQINYIRAVCIYCLFSAITTLLLFIAAAWHLSVTRSGRTGLA
jgi:uncharacterized membrane protein